MPKMGLALDQAAIGIGVLIITVAMIAMVLGGVNDATDVDTYERNITVAGQEAILEFSDWFIIIVIVIIAVVVLGLLKYLGSGGGDGL